MQEENIRTLLVRNNEKKKGECDFMCECVHYFFVFLSNPILACATSRICFLCER